VAQQQSRAATYLEQVRELSSVNLCDGSQSYSQCDRSTDLIGLNESCPQSLLQLLSVLMSE
jgi:hypothetical protein